MDTNNPNTTDPNKPSQETRPTETSKAEVSASTIARMMGVPTVTDIKILEGKIDLFATKLTAMSIKVDKIFTTLAAAPNSQDFDRIDIQIGAVKMLAKEILESLGETAKKAVQVESEEAHEQSKKLRENIRTS